MGTRGPGATRLRKAREALAGQPKQRLPWQKKGLSRAERVIAFLEWLPITKGFLAGTKLELLPAQRDFIQEVYGGREVRIAIDSEPRGNGKTGLLAGLALCHLLGPESRPRGEIYSAAIDRQQAGIMYAEMEAIILAVPQFAAQVNVQRFHKRIEVIDGPAVGSVYEALSADARRAHGLAPSLWVYDELAQARDRELLDNLRTAMGKQPGSLGIIISTQAASNDHPLSELIDDGLTGADSSLYVRLLSAPETADPFSEETLRSVNPAWGKFLNPETVLAEAAQARRMPHFEPRFRNLRLNQRIRASEETPLIKVSRWKACGLPLRQPLQGRACYCGLDLSDTEDLTALILAFDDGEKGFDVLPYFWTPLGVLDDRRPSERDLFRVWIDQDLMVGIPGRTIRLDFIAAKLAELRDEYDIRAIGYDRWGMKYLQRDLDDIGLELPLEPFGQGFQDMGPAVDYLCQLVAADRLRHGDHPVLAANIYNSIVVTDAAGKRKIDKAKSNLRASVRVDGAVALAMAVGTAKKHDAQPVFDMDAFLREAVAA